MPVSERALDMVLPGLKGERVMLNKYNIKDIINDHQREIDEIRAELTITHTHMPEKHLKTGFLLYRTICIATNFRRKHGRLMYE